MHLVTVHLKLFNKELQTS